MNDGSYSISIGSNYINLDFDFNDTHIPFSKLKSISTDLGIELIDVAKIYREKGNIIEDESIKGNGMVSRKYVYLLFGLCAHRAMTS